MRPAPLLFGMLLASQAQAMEALDDSTMASVSGQGGISLEASSKGWSASNVSYTQDGRSLNLRDVSNRAATGTTSTSQSTIDVQGGQLEVQHSSTPQVLAVNNIEMDGSSKSFGSFRAFYTLGATLKLKGGGASGVSGIAVNDSRLSLSDVTFYYRDNGFDLIVKGLSFDTYLNNAYLDIVSGGSGQEVKLNLGDARFIGTVGGISLDLAHGDPTVSPVTPGAPDLRDPNASRSFGKLNMDLRLGGSLSVASGGASGDGIRVRPDLNIGSSLFQYQDEGILRAENFSGTLRSLGGLTIDLAQDAGSSYAQVAFQDLKLNATLGGLIIGNPINQKLGSLAIDLNFADDGAKQNWLKLRPGGDPNSGAKGLTADVSWNMANSSVSLTDNGNSMWFSGLRTNGTGQLTLDLTKSCAGGVSTGCYAGTQSDMGKGNYNGHFDGLRLGLSNIKGGYSFDGLRVGSADAPLQGGTELLVLMEIFPAYDFTLNGQITLLPGGSSGDGVRYNADFVFSDARAAITVDETGKGLWLAGTTYDMHFRDGSVDVSNNGIELRKGTYWSKLEVSDLRWGDRATGTSLGRLVLKRFELGSTLAVSSGGAGALCVGGSGPNAGACSASGGRWEDRGNEGVSVKLKNVFVRDTAIDSTTNGVATDEKRNQIVWETNRVNGAAGTGSQLVVDNFSTSDGNPSDPNANTYGFNADLNLDVAPTKVCTKNGGNCTPVSPDPLGFAVNGRIHFKEINVDRLQHVHPTGGAVTSMYGIKVQNADISANLTATPIN
ncbi:MULTISPECIES: DUF6160 family protein [unclassified Pseudomonas]|jgi:hypothetical protein|uniref:DUF6160 family protein n=1 Tax=unclassified Pseudomonas TaxID=196821 RepID=UPI00129D6931|nr:MULTISPECIES: DUF6160 family protein [unclassified Pseudomonas]MDH4656200.1 hypothetical protein [Pseudomonas sp. BN606]MRK20704.1 hypothetical protein [Pseudomonas sp. JG-B]